MLKVTLLAKRQLVSVKKPSPPVRKRMMSVIATMFMCCRGEDVSVGWRGQTTAIIQCNTAAIFIFSALFLSFRILEVMMTGRIIRGMTFLFLKGWVFENGGGDDIQMFVFLTLECVCWCSLGLQTLDVEALSGKYQQTVISQAVIFSLQLYL